MQFAIFRHFCNVEIEKIVSFMENTSHFVLLNSFARTTRPPNEKLNANFQTKFSHDKIDMIFPASDGDAFGVGSVGEEQ